jgi:hypothetical protein
MIAAYHGHLEVVKLLLDFRADTDIQDCFGKRAIDRAREQPIVDILNAHQRGHHSVEPKSLQVNPFSPKYSPKTRFSNNQTLTNTVSAKKLPGRDSSRGVVSPGNFSSPVNQSVQSRLDTGRRSLSSQQLRKSTNDPKNRQSPKKSVLSPTTKQSPRRDLNQSQLNNSSSPSLKRAMFKEEMIRLLTEQMSTFSEKLLRVVDNRVGLQVPIQVASFEGNVKRELESLMKNKAQHLFRTVQSTLNLKLKFLLHRLGFEQHVDLTPFNEEENINFTSVTFTDEPPIKQIEEKELKALEKDTIQLEKSIIFNTKNVSLGASTILDATMGSDKELEFRSFSHKAQIKQDILDSMNADVRSTTQYVVDYSNAKVNEVVRSETHLLEKKILNELVLNFEGLEEEMKNKFEDYINKKVNEIALLLNSDLNQLRRDRPPVHDNTPLVSAARPSSGQKNPQVSKFKYEPERPTNEVRDSYAVRPSQKSPERSTSLSKRQQLPQSFAGTRERIESIKNTLNFMDNSRQENRNGSFQSTGKISQQYEQEEKPITYSGNVPIAI